MEIRIALPALMWLLLVAIALVPFVARTVEPEKRTPSWRGPLKKRFRLSTFKMEWGRECFITEWSGEIIEQWWEWEE